MRLVNNSKIILEGVRYMQFLSALPGTLLVLLVWSLLREFKRLQSGMSKRIWPRWWFFVLLGTTDIVMMYMIPKVATVCITVSGTALILYSFYIRERKGSGFLLILRILGGSGIVLFVIPYFLTTPLLIRVTYCIVASALLIYAYGMERTPPAPILYGRQAYRKPKPFYIRWGKKGILYGLLVVPIVGPVIAGRLQHEYFTIVSAQIDNEPYHAGSYGPFAWERYERTYEIDQYGKVVKIIGKDQYIVIERIVDQTSVCPPQDNPHNICVYVVHTDSEVVRAQQHFEQEYEKIQLERKLRASQDWSAIYHYWWGQIAAWYKTKVWPVREHSPYLLFLLY